ncbi:hypothetical protein F511_41455 [Dorcoceras hygrometricum]|uniref:Uncharacterized protein n=1 Tax=Dorcoceras hygrometricum TaxID=472368 RepID=A0A2Z7AJS9_9LAMI|nr:hypothetical protein F511_41455 [Dorcoceras hygrometricum]
MQQPYCMLCAPLCARVRPPARPVLAGGAVVARTTVREVRARVMASGRNARRPMRAGRARQARNASRSVRAGYAQDPAIPAAICAWRAPGSDQFHEEIGTSTVDRFQPPNPIHDRNINSFAGIQLAVGSQHLRLQNHIFEITHRIKAKRLATSSHDPLDSIDIHAQGRAMNPRQRSIDSYMHRDLTQPRHLMTPTESVRMFSESWKMRAESGWRSVFIVELEFPCCTDRIYFFANEFVLDIPFRIVPKLIYERGEFSTTKHRILYVSGPHLIPPPDDPQRVGELVKARRLSRYLEWYLAGVYAPGSDQFHEEIGTSTVGGFDLLIRSTTGISIPSQSALENSTNISRTESPCRNGQNKISDDDGGQRRRRGNERRGEERKNKLRRFLAPGSDQFYEEIGTSTVGGFDLLIRSTTGISIPSPVCTRKLDDDFTDGISLPERSEQATTAGGGGGGVGMRLEERRGRIS